MRFNEPLTLERPEVIVDRPVRHLEMRGQESCGRASLLADKLKESLLRVG